MKSAINFKIVIEENGSELYSANLPYQAVADIVSIHEERSNDFFALAAKHPSSSVRENVASQSDLSEEVFNILVNDSAIPVLQNLIRTESFKKYATDELVEKLVRRNADIARSIAEEWDSCDQISWAKVCDTLMSLSDPNIHDSLARSRMISKRNQKKLLSHSDPDVANTSRINYYEEYRKWP